jgi:hypothetical protein
MLSWLGRVLSGRFPRPTQSVDNGRQVKRLALGDAKYVEAALKELPNVGLRFFPVASENLHETAKDIAAQWQGVHFGKEPTIGHWSLIAIAGNPRPFENAAHYSDHCYDGFTLVDYSTMVSEIVALAEREWPIDDVEVRYAERPQGPTGPYPPVSVTIKATPEVSSFELLAAKDFDWSIIFRLNERLPEEATGRFAIFLDGNATIVFLTPDQIRQLNSLCGYDFFYAE